MTAIPAAIQLIRSEIGCADARCTIPSEGGCADESTLMGTRDAYLGLAVALLELVAGADAGTVERLPDEKAYWDDQVKYSLLQLPNTDTYIVGSYLFDSHEDHMSALRKSTEWDENTHMSIDNSPHFRNPNDDAEQGDA